MIINPGRIELHILGYRVEYYPAGSAAPAFDCDIWQAHAPNGDWQDVEPSYSEHEAWSWCAKHYRESQE